jgi:hypothetical protein
MVQAGEADIGFDLGVGAIGSLDPEQIKSGRSWVGYFAASNQHGTCLQIVVLPEMLYLKFL